MQFNDKLVFITGANRGIGKALVEACLDRKVKKVYAAIRKIESLPQWNDTRVVSVMLDVSESRNFRRQ